MSTNQIKLLEAKALKFWPERIAIAEGKLSVIPKLIETQNKFISILNLADFAPFAWQRVLATIPLSLSVFLKHCMVLADIGGEILQRIKPELEQFFPQYKMNFIWHGKKYFYKFKDTAAKWNNTVLKVDGKGFSQSTSLTDSVQDVVNFLFFAGLSDSPKLPQTVAEKCIIGDYLGKEQELTEFIKQRYIHVSRITSGAQSNSLGNIVQKDVENFLKRELSDWQFSKTIPGISQNDNTLTSFDLVAQSPHGKYCAIEISFQVTTNSVIERKAGQAQDRQRILHQLGHRIAYVIDGAGNFQRTSALSSICKYSDCTVTFMDSELNKLVVFLKKFGG